jgi:hypothetical protein
MGHFVKWRGAFLDQGSPAIGRTIQSVEVGQAFRFGAWGASGLRIGPNDPSIAQINPRSAVEGAANNILWFELVGLREGNVMIEMRNPADNCVWDYFQLAVKKRSTKVRPPVRGINYDYYVDTKGINANYNASLVLVLNMSLTPLPGGKSVNDANGTTWTSKAWTQQEWNTWTQRFVNLIQSTWSEKFWLGTPASLTELEVPRPGGKARVNLHCLLKVRLVSPAQAQHKITVVKTSATNGLQFRSHSTLYDHQDLRTDPPTVTGFAQPFNTVVHEIGHTLGLHHACEATTPSTPYCLATNPAVVEVMAKGNALRSHYATPWQNAAAAWFNADSHGHHYSPSDFPASMTRLAPVPV